MTSRPEPAEPPISAGMVLLSIALPSPEGPLLTSTARASCSGWRLARKVTVPPYGAADRALESKFESACFRRCWSPTISPSPLPSGGGELRDVDATSASSAWVVGFTNSSNGNLTLTDRWNGSGWSIVPSPSVSAQNHLLAVKALASGEAWAVGSHNVPGSLAFSTLTMRWRNGAWSVVPSPTGNDATLEGVVALAANDVWAVGSVFSTALLWHVPFVVHWDGRAWTRVEVPSPTPQGGRLFGVAALSPTRVYAVGQAPGIPSLVLRWNGTGWARETTPATGTVWDAAAAGPGTVWAVGQRGNPNTGWAGPSPCGPATADPRVRAAA